MEEIVDQKPFKAWSWSVEQCLKEYKVKLDKGLSSFEVEKRRETFGWNQLQKEKGKPLWRLVLEQFDDMLVKILLVAAFISFVLAYLQGNNSGFEAYVEPFVIVLILILNAVVGVWQEGNAEDALEALKDMQCESAKVLRDGYLVPDLPARELVPGDIVELRVGDKVPADMRVAVLKTSTLRVEQSSLTGEAMPVMKGTNPIQTQIHEASLEHHETPLKKKLDEFGNRLTTAIGLICLIVWVINYKYFLTWELVNGWPTNFQFSFDKCTYYFKIAIALAVAAIPEGLPAFAMMLGFCDGRLFRATGLPTEAALKVLVEKMGVPDSEVKDKIRYSKLLSNYLIDRNTVNLACCEWNKRSKKVATLEFDRVRKSMSVLVRKPNGSNRLLVKGAVESLLERSSYVQLADGSTFPIDEQCRQLLLLRLLEMSSKGLRCIGLAYKDDLEELSDYYTEDHPAHKKLLDPSCYSIESGLIFVGVVGIRDPPREEVHKAIEDCRGAGIKVMVITGDNKSTAEAICKEIRLFSEGEDLRGRSFTDMGEIVAMTGDGVNDAPALKLADIGIAMGMTGTEASFLGVNLVGDGHTLVELSQLRNWGECSSWSNFTASPFTVSGGRIITFSNPCDYFSVGKVKAMTLSLSVLVAIEMFNSLNALSEDNSLIRMPPWRNPWLLIAMSFSLGLHCLILYVLSSRMCLV
ncbi:UNVERIFIED_CONTAM: Calcium-transporting ATPase, endoplasmic reticulum-type [Sesamum radiatum]|uniref:Calcium-transporting ATPase, endoplasmic reticulum-type n=1 Tax=Sesamum radiatum TaxID=300843 RepID=A0AAW2V9N7_SESRA